MLMWVDSAISWSEIPFSSRDCFKLLAQTCHVVQNLTPRSNKVKPLKKPEDILFKPIRAVNFSLWSQG